AKGDANPGESRSGSTIRGGVVGIGQTRGGMRLNARGRSIPGLDLSNPMARRYPTTGQLLLLAIFAVAALSSAQGADGPKSYMLVNWPDGSELGTDDGDFDLPPAPSTEQLVSVGPPCAEMLRVTDQFNLSPTGVYDKIQPFQQE